MLADLDVDVSTVTVEKTNSGTDPLLFLVPEVRLCAGAVPHSRHLWSKDVSSLLKVERVGQKDSDVTRRSVTPVANSIAVASY